MEDFIVKEGKKLRRGYTTGSCAAAAAKAAAWMLLTGYKKEKISVLTPAGIELNLDVREIDMRINQVTCAVEKDGGDDPDVTKGALIVATVTKTEKGVYIDGGFGVGRVTKPGLDQPIGAAAINCVPRKMIAENAEEVCRLTGYTGGLSIVISVPLGEELAKKTFNPRMGITGGISILGTTGIVEPMSEKALVDTIRIELRQKKENGNQYVLLTLGNYGETFIMNGLRIEAERTVQSSNFIGDTLDLCKETGFRGALLVGHIGKLVKLAGGMMNTHSKYGDCRMEIIAAHAAACGLVPEAITEILECVACDDALHLLQENNVLQPTLERLIEKIHFHLNHRSQPVETGAILFSKEYGLLVKTKNADILMQRITEES